MNLKKCIPILLLLSLVVNVILGCKLTGLYKQYQQQAIIDLNNAVFYMTTVLPQMEEAEDWTAAAVVLAQMLYTNQAEDQGDNLVVCQLAKTVAHVNGNQDRTELCEELHKLTFAWDTEKCYCTIIQGDVEKITKLCQAN